MPPFENISISPAPQSIPLDPRDAAQPLSVHPMDSTESKKRLNKISEWWAQARQALADCRYEMAIDEEHYDGHQWSDEDRRELIDRGQIPSQRNLIKTAVDWIYGASVKMRTDFNVLPRHKDQIRSAEVKKDLLKYVQDVNKAEFSRSYALKDAIKVGVGWLEDSIRNDPDEELLMSEYESGRNMWWDHLALKRDVQDGRYIFRSKWVDLDIGIAMFPDRANQIKAAAIASNLYGTDDDEFYWLNMHRIHDGHTYRQTLFDDIFNVNNRRERVRLIECWYREPANVQILHGFPRHQGEVFNAQDPFHQRLLNEGYATAVDATKMMVRCAIFVPDFMLQDIPSPYRHNRFPFTPIWCYRRGRDNTPYGVPRNLRSPQEDLNKRLSKAIFILSTNQVIADNNAVDDWDELAEEVARPDGQIKIKPGTVRFEIRNNTALVEEQVSLMHDDAKYIQDVSGVTDENMGRETNAASGLAIQSRQGQGAITTVEIFDNYRYAFQVQGEKQLSLIEQFYDEPKMVRITGNKGDVDFMLINEEYQNEQGETEINDITASQADFKVDEQQWHASAREALFTKMSEMMQNLPGDVQLHLLDLVIELSDVPGVDEFVARIRKLNGQGDRQSEPSEADQQLAAQKQEEAEQKELAKQTQIASLEAQKAGTRKTLATVALTEEKAKTEQAHQQALLAKPGIDQGKLDVARAKTVGDAMDKDHRHGIERVKLANAANKPQQEQSE